MRIAEAIKEINPDSVFSISGHDIDDCTIEWLEGTSPISKVDIKAKINEFAHQEPRKNEYPTWQEQLDDIYHIGIDGWKATIKVTKDKYPKPD